MMAMNDAEGTPGVKVIVPSVVTVWVPAALKLTDPSGEWLTAPERKRYHTIPGPSVVISATNCIGRGHAPSYWSGTRCRRTSVTRLVALGAVAPRRRLRGGGGLTCEPAITEVRTLASPCVASVLKSTEPVPFASTLSSARALNPVPVDRKSTPSE